MAELETSAWKDDRRFRLLALDRGALTFADLFFHAPGTPRRPSRREDVMAVKENGARESRCGKGVGCGVATEGLSLSAERHIFFFSPSNKTLSVAGW